MRKLLILISLLTVMMAPSYAQDFPAKADTVSIFELDEYLALRSGNLKIALKDMQHYAVDRNGKREYFGYDKYVSILQKYQGLRIDLEILPNGELLNCIQLTNSESVVRLRLNEGIQIAEISNCKNLELIRIPRSLRMMENIFSQADKIELADGDFKIVTYLKAEAVKNQSAPAKASNRYRTPWGSLVSDTEQIIPLNALWGCRKLIEDEASSTGVLFGQRFFYCDSTSRDVVFPDTMTYLPPSLPISEKAKLNSLIFPKRVRTLHSKLLNISSVKKLILPQYADRIEERYEERWSFKGPYCEAFKDYSSIRIPEGIEYIPNSFLMGCGKLTSISIPKTVKRIGSHAFAGCENISDITLPEDLEELGDYAFEGCTSLRSINFPENVTSIGKGVFWACSGLLEKPQSKYIVIDDQEFDYYGTDIVIGNTEEVMKQAFWGYTSLKSVTFKKKVLTINGGAFTGCTSLESITIPDNMYINSKIDDKNHRESPFAYCRSLRRLELKPNIVIDNHVMDLHNSEQLEIVLRQERYFGHHYGIFSTKDEDVTYGSKLNPKTTFYVLPEYVEQYKRDMQDCNRRKKTGFSYTFLPIENQ